jgi:hypothetical protein
MIFFSWMLTRLRRAAPKRQQPKQRQQRQQRRLKVASINSCRGFSKPCYGLFKILVSMLWAFTVKRQVTARLND